MNNIKLTVKPMEYKGRVIQEVIEDGIQKWIVDDTNTDFLFFIREKRNVLLLKSDYTQLADFPAKEKKEWAKYRKELRDYPALFEKDNTAPFPKSPIQYNANDVDVKGAN